MIGDKQTSTPSRPEVVIAVSECRHPITDLWTEISSPPGVLPDRTGPDSGTLVRTSALLARPVRAPPLPTTMPPIGA